MVRTILWFEKELPMTSYMWVVWLVVAVAAAIGEMMTVGLFLAAFAVAAVLTAMVALVPGTFILQVPIFAALSLVGIAVFRPVVLGVLGWHPAEQISGPVMQRHMVNKRAVVTRTVDSAGGQVRVGEGEFWSARSFDPADVMEPGTSVEIVLVEGLTALVAPVVQSQLESSQVIEKGI
jgi:membrane protein implicated in regulation of membrane protease activity